MANINSQVDIDRLLQNIHPSLRGQIGGQLSAQAQPWFAYQDAKSSLPDMDMINRLFNISAGNIGSRMATERGRAQGTMGAIANSRGYANPGAAILGAGTQAASPFVQALGQLEEGRARAQTQLPYQNIQALIPFLQMLMQQNQFNQQREDNQANFWDYAGAFMNPLATLGGAAINKWG